MGMTSIQDLTADLYSANRTKRQYTPRDNEQSAIYISKKFIAFLANEDFFAAPVREQMTSQQSQIMDRCLKIFIGKNPIMKTPVGKLCTRHIFAFISNLAKVQGKAGHKLSKFDIITMLPEYQGADHV